MAAASPVTQARNNRSRLERIHQKFRKSVENGNFYEASQMTKTLYHRYKAQKNYSDAEILLYENILTLLKHDQQESAFDLARLLITLYKESEVAITDTNIDKIVNIVKASANAPTCRKDFIQDALNWTVKSNKHGHPKIHFVCALKFWEEKDYESARQHFIHTSDGTQCASFLIEYHIVSGFPGEIDLFVTQAVLQFLCLQNTLTANNTFVGYTSKHPGIQRKNHPFKQPLLNFIAFLLIIIEKGNIDQYTILCEQYQPSIHRDPTYPMYLDKIGQIFFGLPPPKKEKSGIEGMIGDFMESIFSEPTERDLNNISMESEDVD